MFKMLKSLWHYRGFITGTVKREFQSKYHNSLLGVVWAIIQPLSMIIVYTVIFSQVMRAKLPGVESVFGYSIYLCAGILTWLVCRDCESWSEHLFGARKPTQKAQLSTLVLTDNHSGYRVTKFFHHF